MLAVIKQEIFETEYHLAALKAKHSLFYGQINRSHDPLTSKLPVEIVSKVFTNLLPDNVHDSYGTSIRPFRCTTPIVLGAVCAAWRAIARSTPQLWTFISVNLAGNNGKFVREWLRRSGELPLYININMNDTGKFSGTILDALAPYSRRWFYLAFNISMDRQWKYILPKFSLAHALMLNTIDIRRSIPKGLNLEMIPNLKILYVNELDVDTLLNIDWTKLTHVVTSFESIDILFELFSSASSLEHCEFTLTSDKMNRVQDTVIRNNRLVFLRINPWNLGAPIDFTLEWMEFPALRHLVIGPEVLQANLNTTLNLLHRSRCTLQTLEIDITPDCECPYEALYITPFLAEIPTLEILEIRREVDCNCHESCESVDPLLTQLSISALIPETATNQSPFLPNLRNLRIINLESSWNCVLDMLLAHANPAQTLAPVRSSEETQRPPRIRPLCSFYIKLPVWGDDDEKVIPVVHDTPPVFQCTFKDGIEVTLAAGLDNEPGYLPFRENLEQSLRSSEM